MNKLDYRLALMGNEDAQNSIIFKNYEEASKLFENKHKDIYAKFGDMLEAFNFKLTINNTNINTSYFNRKGFLCVPCTGCKKYPIFYLHRTYKDRISRKIFVCGSIVYSEFDKQIEKCQFEKRLTVEECKEVEKYFNHKIRIEPKFKITSDFGYNIRMRFGSLASEYSRIYGIINSNLTTNLTTKEVELFYRTTYYNYFKSKKENV